MLSPKLQNYFADLPFLLVFYGPEAADLGDLMRLWVRPRVWVHLSFVFFKDNEEHARHIRRQGDLPTNSPISKQSEFMETLLNRKDNASLNLPSASLNSFTWPHNIHPSCGILTRLPFKWGGKTCLPSHFKFHRKALKHSESGKSQHAAIHDPPEGVK